MIKSTCKAIMCFALCVSVLAAIRAIVVVLQMRWIPRGYGLRQPYVAELIPLLIIIALAVLVAVSAFKLADAINAEISFLRKKVIEAEKLLEEQQKEINALFSKIDVLKKEPTP